MLNVKRSKINQKIIIVQCLKVLQYIVKKGVLIFSLLFLLSEMYDVTPDRFFNENEKLIIVYNLFIISLAIFTIISAIMSLRNAVNKVSNVKNIADMLFFMMIFYLMPQEVINNVYVTDYLYVCSCLLSMLFLLKFLINSIEEMIWKYIENNVHLVHTPNYSVVLKPYYISIDNIVDSIGYSSMGNFYSYNSLNDRLYKYYYKKIKGNFFCQVYKYKFVQYPFDISLSNLNKKYYCKRKIKLNKSYSKKLFIKNK